jgi:hypothetical protein
MLGEREMVQTIVQEPFSRHPRQFIPDATRESRIEVGGASAVVDVA